MVSQKVREPRYLSILLCALRTEFTYMYPNKKLGIKPATNKPGHQYYDELKDRFVRNAIVPDNKPKV